MGLIIFTVQSTNKVKIVSCCFFLEPGAVTSSNIQDKGNFFYFLQCHEPSIERIQSTLAEK